MRHKVEYKSIDALLHLCNQQSIILFFKYADHSTSLSKQTSKNVR